MSQQVKLSLCVIVGKNESKELERCLKSVQGPLFDEIVVALTQEDPEVEAIARKYADKTPRFEWVHDFSAARNFSFDQATGNYLMWLDADDELTPDNYKKILDMKESLHQYDYVYITYNYGHDDQGRPSVTLPRERIVRNGKDLRWYDPIHEYILTHGGHRRLERPDIAVDHRRTREYDPTRNLTILKKEYDRGDATPRIKFYYAKDLMDNKKEEEAVKIFEEYLKGPTDYAHNKVVACLKMYNYYTFSKNDTVAAVSFLRKASMYSNQYAEVYYFLGCYYQDQGDVQEAEQLFLTAKSKDPQGLFGAKPAFYKKYPLDKLMKIYHDRGEYKKSLEVVEEFLMHYPEDANYQRNKIFLTGKVDGPIPDPEPVRAPSKPHEEVKVAWLLRYFNPVDPSQRIRRLNIHQEMQEQGVTSVLFTNYQKAERSWLLDQLSSSNVVVSSVFDEEEYGLIQDIQAKGIKVVVDLNEDLVGNPLVQKILGVADAVITCSSALLEKAKPFSKKLAVVEDAVEKVEKSHDHFLRRFDQDGVPLNPVALYMGMGGNSFLVTDYLKDVIAEAGYDLVVCTEWDNADEKWELETWQEVMSRADVVLCPQRVDVQPAKSNIKAAQAMAFGIPVVASPLPAYKEFIEPGRSGYICDGKGEWLQALRELKDIKKRIQVGLNGQDVAQKFSVDAITKKWVAKADQIVNSVPAALPAVPAVTAPAQPTESLALKQTVPIVIPVYNEVEYLKACVTSIHMNTLYPYHIVVSDAGSNEDTWAYLDTLKGITVLGSRGVRKNFSEAVNDGVSATGDSRFFVILNSDVLVSKGWLTNMVKKMETTDRLAVCGVLSNCDRGWLHSNPRDPQSPVFNMRLPSSGLELVPGMKYDQIIPRLDELNAFMENSNKELEGKYMDQAWVAYYATIFAKSAWNDVGYLDPQYQNGCEDLDHARRISKQGYRIGQSLDSFVYHFGGISRGAYQGENKESYDKEDAYNHQLFHKKWEKKEVVIYTGPAWEKWGREDVDMGMAGSETWAAELSAEFSKRGYRTTLFGDPKVEEIDRDGVSYLHHSRFKDYVEYRNIDMCILSRTCEPLKTFKMHTTNLYVMVHDVWLHHEKSYDTMKWAVKKFGVLSDWHQSFFGTHHSIPNDKMLMTFNGVRHDNYGDVDHSIKKNKMVYSSSPDRGLELLLHLLPEIRKEIPDFEIDVAYGFHNWESMAKTRGDQVGLDRIEAIKKQMKQPGVNYLGRINKKELATRQKESKIWAYPTWFSETFCITAVENGLAGNAVVTTPYGGLLTTLGPSGLFIKGPEGLEPHRWSGTPEYQGAFLREVIALLKDEDYRRVEADKVRDHVSQYTWERAADQWVQDSGI